MAKKKSVKAAAASRKRGRSESETGSDSTDSGGSESPVTSPSNKDGSKKKRKMKAAPRMYQCPHCPAEPPYAGASGLWYHMKRHHGAVTRPYNKTKNRADGTYGSRPIKAKTSVTKKQAKLSKLKKEKARNHKSSMKKQLSAASPGRSKFPSSPRYRRQPMDDEEDDIEYESDYNNNNNNRSRAPSTSSSAFTSNGLIRNTHGLSVGTLNPMQLQGILQSSRELDALKSLSSSPLAKSHRKQMTMNSNLRSSNQLINGGSTEGQTMVTVGEGPSSSEMLLLSEVALLLETSNNQAVAVLKTTTTTTTTTTTEVSSQKVNVSSSDMKGMKKSSPESDMNRVASAVGQVAHELNHNMHRTSMSHQTDHAAHAMNRSHSNAPTETTERTTSMDSTNSTDINNHEDDNNTSFKIEMKKTPKKTGISSASASSTESDGNASPTTQRSPLSANGKKEIKRALDMNENDSLEVIGQ